MGQFSQSLLGVRGPVKIQSHPGQIESVIPFLEDSWKMGRVQFFYLPSELEFE